MIFPKSLVFVRRKLGTTGCSLVQALPLLCSFYSNVSKAGLILEYFFLVSFSSSTLELSDSSRGLQYKGLTIRKVTNTVGKLGSAWVMVQTKPSLTKLMMTYQFFPFQLIKIFDVNFYHLL